MVRPPASKSQKIRTGKLLSHLEWPKGLKCGGTPPTGTTLNHSFHSSVTSELYAFSLMLAHSVICWIYLRARRTNYKQTVLPELKKKQPY